MSATRAAVVSAAHVGRGVRCHLDPVIRAERNINQKAGGIPSQIHFPVSSLAHLATDRGTEMLPENGRVVTTLHTHGIKKVICIVLAEICRRITVAAHLQS